MPIRQRLTGAFLTTALVLVAGACTDDTSSSGRAAGPTTTVDADPTGVAASEPTTTVAAAGGPGSPAADEPSSGPADVWTAAPGEPSPLELGTGAPEPEYPAGADGTVADLADGELDVIVHQVDESGLVLVDVVVLIVGDDAEAAARADGILRPDERLTGNYYVRNPNPKLRSAVLDDSVEVSGEAGADVTAAAGIDDVVEVLTLRVGAAPGVPYRATVRDGRVTALVVPAVDDPTL